MGGWGGALNIKMELMYQRPKVDYSVATLLAMLSLCLGPPTKGGPFLFIIEIGVFITPWWNLRCIMLFSFFFCLHAVGRFNTVRRGIKS